MNVTDAERSAIARAVTSGRLLSDVARDHDLPESTVREIAAGAVRETTPGERTAYDRVLAALDPLDDPARSRVLRWARDRYAPSALGATSPPGGPDA